MHYYENKSIKEWVAEDRPREKLNGRGKDALTDAELLAILIASGTRKHSALDLARMMLEKYAGLKELSRLSVQELCQFPGIGTARASNIAVAFELARRGSIEGEAKKSYNSSQDLGPYLCAKLGNFSVEVFYVLFLDNHNQILSEKELFRGGKESTVVEPKSVFKEAIGLQASRIVVCHNHPSGKIVPSKADDNVTAKLMAYSKMVGIDLIDHLIVAGRRWYSYADTGELRKIRQEVDFSFEKASAMTYKY